MSPIIMTLFLASSFVTPTVTLKKPDHTAPKTRDSLQVEVVPASDAEAKGFPQASLEVVEASLSIRGNEFSSILYGEIRNIGISSANFVNVDVAVFDGDGQLLDTTTGWVHYSTCSHSGDGAVEDCIATGDEAWFEAHLGAGQDDIAQIELRVRGNETVAAAAIPVLEPGADLQVVENESGLVLNGTVRNISTTDVVLVTITAALRDATDALVAVGAGYVPGDRIGGFGSGVRAGDEGSFEIRLPDVDFSSYELLINWRQYLGASHRYAVAGVAHTVGVDGASWQSSLALTNRSGAAGHVVLTYYHSGEPVAVEMDLADAEMVFFDDVVATLFAVEGDSAGYVHFHSDVPLTITARTANVSSEGSYGQLLPTLTSGDTMQFRRRGLLSPLHGGDAFRSNIGLINLSEGECQVRVDIFGVDGVLAASEEITIDPQSWRQLNDVMPAGLETGYAMVEGASYCAVWAYASVINRSTGDPAMVPLDLETTTEPFPYRIFRAPAW